MKEYNLIEFIESFLIPDLKKMIECELHYYAFSVICQAIEVMGSVYDQKKLDDYGASESRFDNGITNLFKDKRYREKQNLFFSTLRGPLIHQLRPGKGLFISSEKKDKIKKENHLEKHDSGSTILVIEQFFEDFATAFGKLVSELDKRADLDNSKVYSPFLHVSTIDPPHPTTWWDEETENLLTITPTISGSAMP